MALTLREIVESWDKDTVDASEMLSSIRNVYPNASDDEIREAVETVARGPFSPASSCAATTLSHLHGLDDPFDTASYWYNASEEEPTDPQWLVFCASYTYGWIINSGLSACYYEFDAQQYGDRIRVFEVIGATKAAEVMREADRAFGKAGPPPVVEDRSSFYSDDAVPLLEALNQKFWDCGDEIATRSHLYALENVTHFTPPRKWEPY